MCDMSFSAVVSTRREVITQGCVDPITVGKIRSPELPGLPTTGEICTVMHRVINIVFENDTCI